jgi:hypothetical protein
MIAQAHPHSPLIPARGVRHCEERSDEIRFASDWIASLRSQ